MMEGTLSEYAFYLLFPCSLLVGLLCLAKHIIRRTEFFHNDDSLEGKTIVVTEAMLVQSVCAAPGYRAAVRRWEIAGGHI
ncbi:hypothetical protein HPB51_001532 [Rhipicephalus microplus]|uniref:Uncharacterized protein n=1 Tax=Rhipicephalus microplus TaxID=6941 RepID=A0A9J6EVQ8_RHIMP|nr:hypothetical protein HPB51_001532 [Rhipicephalus microplus]